MPAETILIADDEATVRAYTRSILRSQGFNVLEASDGVDALQQVQERGRPVDLLLTDIRMPRMDGISLARSVMQMYPDTAVLYISGYPFELGEERTKNPKNVCASLAKPFSKQALLDAVRKCLAPPETARSQTS